MERELEIKKQGRMSLFLSLSPFFFYLFKLVEAKKRRVR